jgi:hypothetical protein
MDTKKLQNIMIIILLVIIISFLVYIGYNKYYTQTEKYKENPKHWIEKQDDVVLVDVSKVNGGQSEYDGFQQQYNDEEYSTVFIMEAWYDGEFFRKNYIQDEKVIFNLGNDINPKDDTMDILITETFYNKEPYINIFLDKKWQEKYGQVNIWYGKEYEHYHEFDFSETNEISNGVYHNKIKDDITRFNLNSYPLQGQGGLLLGNLHRNDWFNKTPEGKIVVKFD